MYWDNLLSGIPFPSDNRQRRMQRTYIVTGSFQQSYDSFIFLLNDCQQSALLIYDTTPPKVVPHRRNIDIRMSLQQ